MTDEDRAMMKLQAETELEADIANERAEAIDKIAADVIELAEMFKVPSPPLCVCAPHQHNFIFISNFFT